MRLIRLAFLVAVFSPVESSFAREGWKVEGFKQSPPAAVGADVRKVLGDQGFRIFDDQGQKFAEIWLRRGIPGSSRPAGPKGAIQFPFLKEGEVIGVLEFAVEGHDYRDQSIAKGLYTLRYGLQPVNGDHLGVSTYRDYSLLLPASKDQSLALPTRKQLEERSAESAGTSHPAVLIMLMAPANSKGPSASMIQDTEKNTWSVVLPLQVQVQAETGPIVYPVRLVVEGAAQV